MRSLREWKNGRKQEGKDEGEGGRIEEKRGEMKRKRREPKQQSSATGMSSLPSTAGARHLSAGIFNFIFWEKLSQNLKFWNDIPDFDALKYWTKLFPGWMVVRFDGIKIIHPVHPNQ